MSGLWALRHIADRWHVHPRIARSMCGTFLASAFRSIRFGINQAHGRGVAVQLNHSLDLGAVIVARDGTFSVVEQRMVDAVTD